MRTRFVAALAAGGLMAGCGGGADGAIEETADKLGELRSGQLSVKLLVSPSVEGADLGFELKGPFELSRRDGELPLTKLVYTQIAGEQRGDVGFISNATGAWVEVEGQPYELPPDRVKSLRGAGPGGDEGGPLGDLDIASWTSDEKSAESGDTERITADVEVVEAINDAIGALGDVGGGAAVGALEPLEGDEADKLEKAVESATMELVTGTDDRLLRRLRISLDIGTDAPRELPGGLGNLSGAAVLFDLRVDDPNEPIEVQTPADALPYESLPRG